MKYETMQNIKDSGTEMALGKRNKPGKISKNLYTFHQRY